MTTYTSITQEEANKKIRELEKQNRYIDKNIQILFDELQKDKPRQNFVNIIASKLYDNKEIFNKLKKYFNNLSILNFRSNKKNINIFKKIKMIRTISQNLQTGDITYIRTNVQSLLSSQVNTKKSTIIYAKGKTKRRKIKKEPKKNKLKTNKKKLNFKNKLKLKTSRIRSKSKKN